MNDQQWSYDYGTPPAPAPTDAAPPNPSATVPAPVSTASFAAASTLPLPVATVIVLGLHGYRFLDEAAFDPSLQLYFTRGPWSRWPDEFIATHHLFPHLGPYVAVPGTFELAALAPDSDEFIFGRPTASHPWIVVHVEEHHGFVALTVGPAPFPLPACPIDPRLLLPPPPTRAQTTTTSTPIAGPAATTRTAPNHTAAANVPWSRATDRPANYWAPPGCTCVFPKPRVPNDGIKRFGVSAEESAQVQRRCGKCERMKCQQCFWPHRRQCRHCGGDGWRRKKDADQQQREEEQEGGDGRNDGKGCKGAEKPGKSGGVDEAAPRCSF